MVTAVANEHVSKPRSMTYLLVFLFMSLFFALVSINFVMQVNQYNNLKRDQNRLLQQIEEQQQEKIKLSSWKDYYQSDAYLEKVAREQLGLVKSNEILFVNREKQNQ